MKKLILFICSVFYFLACSNIENTNKEADIQAIRAVSEKVVKAWNDGDYDGYIVHFDAEVILLPQNAPPIEGIESVKSLYENSFNTLEFSVEATIKETKVSGNLGFELGTWMGSMIPKDGSAPIDFNNKVLCIYKKQEDGSWKMYRMMYSSNNVPEELHIPEKVEIP